MFQLFFVNHSFLCMHTMDTPSSLLITALGGPSEVARILRSATNSDISPQAVTGWKRHGIPRGRVLELAIARGAVIRSIDEAEPENWSSLFPGLGLPESSKSV